MTKPDDVPQEVWDRAIAIETGYEGGENGRRPVFIARAIMAEREAGNADRLRTLVSDMLTIILNRCDEKDPKVKAVLLRAIEEMSEPDFIPD